MKDLTEQQGLDIIGHCLNQMKDRFVISQTSFTIKVIRKEGVKIIRDVAKPPGG